MLVAKLKVWSANGIEGDRDVGEMAIVNDGTGTHKEGNYTCTFSWPTPGGRKITRSVRVEKYDRVTFSAWELVRLALEQIAKESKRPGHVW